MPAWAAGWSNLVDLEARLVRVQYLRPTPDFEPLAAAFKRIHNILAQAKFVGGASIDQSLLEAGPEQELFEEIPAYRGSSRSKTRSRGALHVPKRWTFQLSKVALVNVPDVKVRV